MNPFRADAEQASHKSAVLYRLDGKCAIELAMCMLHCPAFNQVFVVHSLNKVIGQAISMRTSAAHSSWTWLGV